MVPAGEPAAGRADPSSDEARLTLPGPTRSDLESSAQSGLPGSCARTDREPPQALATNPPSVAKGNQVVGREASDETLPAAIPVWLVKTQRGADQGRHGLRFLGVTPRLDVRDRPAAARSRRSTADHGRDAERSCGSIGLMPLGESVGLAPPGRRRGMCRHDGHPHRRPLESRACRTRTRGMVDLPAHAAAIGCAGVSPPVVGRLFSGRTRAPSARAIGPRSTNSRPRLGASTCRGDPGARCGGTRNNRLGRVCPGPRSGGQGPRPGRGRCNHEGPGVRDRGNPPPYLTSRVSSAGPLRGISRRRPMNPVPHPGSPPREHLPPSRRAKPAPTRVGRRRSVSNPLDRAVDQE